MTTPPYTYAPVFADLLVPGMRYALTREGGNPFMVLSRDKNLNNLTGGAAFLRYVCVAPGCQQPGYMTFLPDTVVYLATTKILENRP